MNVILWIVQVVLTLKFLSVTISHGLRQDAEKMQRGVERFGRFTQPVLVLTALGTFVTSVGLILPPVLGVMTWLTPLSAALLALMMLLGLGFHIGCRERPYIWVAVILFALAAFVAYGRWMLAPLT